MSRRSRQRNSRCRPKRNKKVTKTRPDVTDRKASPDAPDFFLIFFGRVDPNTTRSHRQTPPIAIARSFQHAEKWPFRRRGGECPPPLARGRSSSSCAAPSCAFNAKESLTARRSRLRRRSSWISEIKSPFSTNFFSPPDPPSAGMLSGGAAMPAWILWPLAVSAEDPRRSARHAP